MSRPRIYDGASKPTTWAPGSLRPIGEVYRFFNREALVDSPVAFLSGTIVEYILGEISGQELSEEFNELARRMKNANA